MQGSEWWQLQWMCRRQAAVRRRCRRARRCRGAGACLGVSLLAIPPAERCRDAHLPGRGLAGIAIPQLCSTPSPPPPRSPFDAPAEPAAKPAVPPTGASGAMGQSMSGPPALGRPTMMKYLSRDEVCPEAAPVLQQRLRWVGGWGG